MAVTGGVGQTINVGQGLGVAEITGLAYWKVQSDWSSGAPVGGDLKLGAQAKVRVEFAPVGTPGN